ncbi:YbgC/FadM family acyl-CoA thioesterase [Ideonella sp. BN130291]|uniref:YbgC/FadM family acyl-CoA thioesterase n=1 Tax=Ideonella sp. BN130291 TaxID=3112940 RepID=UPI002E253B34|nr:YbgC/FadM family acyl-CoA thioesterase [Ideonella sp. BN130291]
MSIRRKDFRFLDRQRVRWVEVDMQKIVFNGHYLAYFDNAVAGYWRAMALPYAQTMEYLGGDLFVRKATLEYESSARYDDVLDVGIRCARIGNSSMNFGAAVFRGEDLLVSGELVYVFADPHTQTSRPVPQELRDVLQGFEAGKTMVEVRVGGWDELGGDAQQIRRAVFVDEQKIPAEMEWDGADPSCTHAVAYNRFGVPLATGRLLEHVPGVAKIGRMAVSQTMRGSRVGRAVLDALMDAARTQGFREAVLHAQMSAAPFYSRAGFVERGPAFDEAGITHVEMVRAL